MWVLGIGRNSFGQPQKNGVPKSPALRGSFSLSNCLKSGTQLLRKCLNRDLADREELLSWKSSGKYTPFEGAAALLHN